MKKILLAAMLVFGMLVSAMALAPSEFEKNATPENAVLVYGFVTPQDFEDERASWILFSHLDPTKEYASAIDKIKSGLKFKSTYKHHQQGTYIIESRVGLIPIKQTKVTTRDTSVYWGLCYPDSYYSFVSLINGSTVYQEGIGWETELDFKTTKQVGTIQYLGDKGLGYEPNDEAENKTKEEIAAYKKEEKEMRIKALKMILPNYKKGTHWYDVIMNEISNIEEELKNEE